MEYSEYISLISEYYDLSDPDTANKVVFCNEAEKQTNVEHLTNRLYNMIRSKVDSIDFGTIPNSKGDVTKIENYTQLVECINVITSLIKEYNQPTHQIDVLSTALNNIQNRTRLWEKAFALHIEFPMIMYNTIVLSIVSSVNLLIMTCIEYVKNADDTIETSFNKASYMKTKDHVLFNTLRDFNMACTKGDTDQVVNACIKNNLTAVKEACDTGDDEYLTMMEFGIENTRVAIGGIILLLLNARTIIEFLIKGIRNVTYYFFRARENVADMFTTEAEFLQINAENLKYRDKYKNNEEERKKVYDKQMKWVDRFKKIANFFMIKDTKARKEAEKDTNEDSKPSKREDDNSDGGGLF